VRRGRSNLELFGVSFLDILSCTLGGVLLLLLIVMQRKAEESQAARAHVIDLQDKIGILLEEASSGRAQLAAIQTELGKANAGIEKLTGEKEALEEKAAEDHRQLALINARYEAIAKGDAAKAGEIEKLANDKEKLLDEGAKVTEQLARIISVLEQKQGEVKQLRNDKARLEERQTVVATLIGLKGELRNVIFIFDRSDSMKERDFKRYYALLKNWILHLKIESFEVIMFNDQTETCFQQLQPVDPALHGAQDPNRREAADWVDEHQPGGKTDTLGAFKLAFQDYPDADTIVFLSDGRPNYGGQTDQQVLDELAKMNLDPNTGKRKVVINTVAMGNYFAEEWGTFLQNIAEQHDGVFIGR